MGTPCTLVRPVDDRFAAITVNFDGYPSHMLNALSGYYSPESVVALFEMGDARFLDERGIDKSEFYHRDANEDYDDLKPRTHDSAQAAKQREIGSYAYLYDPANRRWKII